MPVQPQPTVALLIETSRAYGRGLCTGVAEYARNHGGWNFLLQERDLREGIPEWLPGWQGDGILCRVSDPALAELLSTSACPVVDLYGGFRHPAIPFLDTDAAAVARMAARFFLDAAFDRFAFCGFPGLWFSDERCGAYVEHLRELGFSCSVYQTPDNSDSGNVAVREALHPSGSGHLEEWVISLPNHTAILACNDVRAQQLLTVAGRVGRRIPEELAVMGVDDDELICELTNPVDGNGWSWVALPTPVVLQGGQYYVIAMDNVTNSLDPYFDPDRGPGVTATIVAPGSTFRNGTGASDAYMIGRWGLAAGQEGYPTTGYLGASFQYTLDTAPVITTDLPVTTVVAQGGNTTLSVTLSPAGYPAATYRWEHDPLPIDGIWVEVGTDPTFSINSATAAEAGDYRVTVSNAAGADQSLGSVEVDSDTDNDGLGNAVETNTGIYVSPSDTGTKPNDDDSDDDGLKDGEEVLTIKTNPTIADTDGDGLNDGSEINTHATNPLVADTDADGLPDGAEVNDHTTNPLLVDTDADGVRDGYEVANGSSPTNPASPGGPNPTAIAVRFDNQFGEVTGYGLSSIMYAGAPAVRQKNWNSTNPDAFPAVGTQANIVSPSPGVAVDSAGNPTTMTVSYSAVGAWSDDNEDETTYGRLFGPFIYNDNVDRDVNVSLGNIPFAAYDVYVYMGAAANGFTGTVTSGAKTYSYTSASAAGGLNSYVETTSPTGFPQANYCVFRNVTGSTFAFKVSHGSGNAGVFGLQVVASTATAYQTWAGANGLDPHSDGAPGVDKENDGSSNLLEYAFFTNPNSGSSIPVFLPAVGGGNLSLTYHRAKAATDVTYTAQWTENLTDWFSTELTDLPTGNGTADTVERVITVSQDGEPKKFLRILVAIPTS